jgi:hypothetical protein
MNDETSLVDHEDIFRGPFFSDLFRAHASLPVPSAVVTYDGIGEADFARHRESSTPFAIRWGEPATKPELLDALSRYLGDRSLPMRYDDYVEPGAHTDARRTRQLSFHDFIEVLAGGEVTNPYLGNILVEWDIFDALALTRPEFLPVGDLVPPRLWIGGSGSQTPLHKDYSAGNFAIVLHGQKLWTLYPVRDAPKLGLRRKRADFATSTLSEADQAALAACCDVTRLRFVQEAGLLLFVPAGWSHAVDNSGGLTAMLNVWVEPKALAEHLRAYR